MVYRRNEEDVEVESKDGGVTNGNGNGGATDEKCVGATRTINKTIRICAVRGDMR